MVGFEAGFENELSVTIKKTINVRPYEPEVIEGSMTCKVKAPLTCWERAYLLAELQSEVEKVVFEGMMGRGLISFDEYTNRMNAAELHCNRTKNELINNHGEGALNTLWAKVSTQ